MKPILAVVFAVVCWCGCSDSADECVAVDPECAPLYTPTFEEVFARTLKPKCGIGSNCHSGSTAKAGLQMDEVNQSYELLKTRLRPNDAACSLLIKRLDGAGGLMPPGNQLSEAERCAVQQWIAAGALRD